MATDMKRFTVSIPHDMESGLDALKKEKYYKTTRSEMIRDLLERGLESFHSEKKIRGDNE